MPLSIDCWRISIDWNHSHQSGVVRRDYFANSLSFPHRDIITNSKIPTMMISRLRQRLRRLCDWPTSSSRALIGSFKIMFIGYTHKISRFKTKVVGNSQTTSAKAMMEDLDPIRRWKFLLNWVNKRFASDNSITKSFDISIFVLARSKGVLAACCSRRPRLTRSWT